MVVVAALVVGVLEASGRLLPLAAPSAGLSVSCALVVASGATTVVGASAAAAGIDEVG